MKHSLMENLRIDAAELERRRSFFEITEDDLKRLAALRPFAERNTREIVEHLYRLILGHPESRKSLRDETLLERVQRAQCEYFLRLFSGRCDLDYVEDRLRIGLAHERAAIPPKWYLGAYARYLRIIFERLNQHVPDKSQAELAYSSVEKLVAFDMALAMDAYIAANLDTIAHHEAAIRELSTPIIRLHQQALLVPLVGTIDAERAEQLMRTVLSRVVQEQARVVIIDIAGVPVLDTQIAAHLLETTEAVRLLGAHTILSGVSPRVARSVTELGINISTMHTCSQLAHGLQAAFDLLGKRIADR